MTTSNSQAIKAALAEKPDAVLDFISRDLGVSLAEVIECLPDEERLSLPAESFEEVMNKLSELGTITFIVHTSDIVLECKGTVPKGSFGRGYFNIHGDSPIGGHIKAENCGSVHFLSRNMMGRPSNAVVVCNKQGEAMFKVYLGRDENRELIPEQVEKFNQLSDQLKARLEARKEYI